jgi:ligand-binding sensor domain-containing protein
MKFSKVCTLLLISTFLFSCAEQPKKKTEVQSSRHRTGLTRAELKEAAKSKVPRSMTRNVRLASNGDVLIASYMGVYRYNGSSFTNITQSIEWPTFWDVLEDRSGNLWLASQDSGVYFSPVLTSTQGDNTASFQQTNFQLMKQKDGLAPTSALHIREDRAGNIWFGATVYDGKSFHRLSTKDGFPSNNIRLLLEDKTGKQWFCAQAENLYVYDGKTFTVVKNEKGQPFNNVWSVLEDSRGYIWFGDAAGFWRYNGKSFDLISTKNAYAISQDKKGNIWTTGAIEPAKLNQTWSLTRYDQNTLYNEEPTSTEIMKKQDMLLGIVEDNQGNIWFGAGDGVYRYDGKTITDFKDIDNQKK